MQAVREVGNIHCSGKMRGTLRNLMLISQLHGRSAAKTCMINGSRANFASKRLTSAVSLCTTERALMSSAPDDPVEIDLDRENPSKDSGFIRFYGLYWRKSAVNWQVNKQLLGQPQKWMGKGKIAKDFDRSTVQMNFWGQKGVYILYDDGLQPVYAGQAGLSRSNASEGGQSIGARLNAHQRGVYRNGWSLFSWFGFLETDKIELKTASNESRMEPKWSFPVQSESDLNQLLASFEAILIEGFAPRFNARGGDLGKAVIVDQFEPQPQQH